MQTEGIGAIPPQYHAMESKWNVCMRAHLYSQEHTYGDRYTHKHTYMEKEHTHTHTHRHKQAHTDTNRYTSKKKHTLWVIDKQKGEKPN